MGNIKGGRFERAVCKQLSLWITHGKKEDCFWRSAMSGGRATRAASVGKNLRRQAGDITATAPEGHLLTDAFFIECKHYKDLKIQSFFLSQRGVLAKFWLKACKEAAKYDKDPLMIACQNNVPTLVIVRTGALRDFMDEHRSLSVIRLTVRGPTDFDPKSYAFCCEVYKFNELMKRKFERRSRLKRKPEWVPE